MTHFPLQFICRALVDWAQESAMASAVYYPGPVFCPYRSAEGLVVLALVHCLVLVPGLLLT